MNYDVEKFKGKPCKKCGSKIRYAKDKRCVTCNSKRCKDFHRVHREERKQQMMEWKEKTGYSPITWIEAGKRWAKEHPEELRKLKAKWKKKHLDKNAFYTTKRYAAKKQRTPSWLTEEHWLEILGYYAVARTLTTMTNVQYDVDHVNPVQGKSSFGLHVPWNLQVITHEENMKKSNKLLV